MEGGGPWQPVRASAVVGVPQAAGTSQDPWGTQAPAAGAGPSRYGLPAQMPQYGCESAMRASLTARTEHRSSQFSQRAAPAAAAHAIFLCDPRTEEECLSRSLLGLPASQAQVVRGIVPELSLLFLFNVRGLPAHCWPLRDHC
jgi:hypothetical protein